VRNDLPLGTLAAQVTHAAGASSPGNLPLNTTAVVLGVDSEQHLKEEEERLSREGVVFSAVREPDPPYNGQLMAIGVRPNERRNLEKYFEHLKLLRR
jgi:peptidyl-tRNA hydrolase